MMIMLRSVLRTRGVASRRSLPGVHEVVAKHSTGLRRELAGVRNVIVRSNLLLRVSVENRVILAGLRVHWNLVLAGKLPRSLFTSLGDLGSALCLSRFGSAWRD